MGGVLKDYRVIAAIADVELNLRLFQVEIPPPAAVGQHGDFHLRMVFPADLREEMGHVVKIGMAVSDEQYFHGRMPPYLFFSVFYHNFCNSSDRALNCYRFFHFLTG